MFWPVLQSKDFLQNIQNTEDFKSISVSDKWVKYFQKAVK
jgi:hypothetical protein